MVPTTRLRSLAVVPPPPSYDPSSYEPFDDHVSRTIDQILNEEASFESVIDEDWPVFSGGDSPSASIRPTQQSDKDLKESRFFSKTPASTDMGTTAKGKRKPVAKRNITVIDLDNGSEDDETSLEVNGQEPKEVADDVPEAENEADNESPMDDQPHNDVDVSMDMWSPMSQAVDGVTEPSISIDPVAADEEDAIFASVDTFQRDHLLHYLASHPFMQNSVQPVPRSARRSFVSEMRREATTAGMDETAVDRLIEYVRKLYLEDLGVEPQTFPEGLDEIPFGEEIDDDHLEGVRRRKSRKRGLDSGERTDSKKKKRKTDDKKSSNEISGSSLQSTMQRDVSARFQDAESLQNPRKLQDDENDAVIPDAGVECHDSAADSRVDEPLKATDNADHAPQDVMEQTLQYEEPAGRDVPRVEQTTIEANGNTVSLGEQPMGELELPGRQADTTPRAPDKSILVENSHSEPELPPNNATLRRGSKDKGDKNVRKEERPKKSKSKKNPRSIEIHADENAASENHPSLPSKPESTPKFVRDASTTMLEANQPGHREEQRYAKESSKEEKENGVRNISGDVVRRSPPAKTDRETKTESTEKQSKKLANWRKKERKKMKKRNSHLGLKDNPPMNAQVPEPPSTLPPTSIPASISEPKTPNKGPKKSKFPELSPNPAEWDLDF